MRAFVAVDIPQEVRENEGLRHVLERLKGVPGLRLVSPSALHITLAFMGEIAEDQVAATLDALSSVKEPAFQISLRGLGGFPRDQSCRVVWLGVDEDAATLVQSLAESVRRALDLKALPYDKKPFAAHVTIARSKIPVDIKAAAKEVDAQALGRFVVKEFRLKQSVLRAEGPTYSDVAVFPLEGTALRPGLEK
ncbi:MAG: RNA 2',3'-cyclic phosphodiesterase [Thermoprotei archaeon]|nr:RNA 2',3'-cyclic phosphodiesterase [TACK group archaeon]